MVRLDEAAYAAFGEEHCPRATGFEIDYEAFSKDVCSDTPSPKLFQAVADAYAKRFLGRSTYDLDDVGSRKEFRQFRKAAGYVGAKAGLLPFDVHELTGLLFDALRDAFPSSYIFPAHLSSDSTWQCILPQYLRKKYPT